MTRIRLLAESNSRSRPSGSLRKWNRSPEGVQFHMVSESKEKPPCELTLPRAPPTTTFWFLFSRVRLSPLGIRVGLAYSLAPAFTRLAMSIGPGSLVHPIESTRRIASSARYSSSSGIESLIFRRDFTGWMLKHVLKFREICRSILILSIIKDLNLICYLPTLLTVFWS